MLRRRSALEGLDDDHAPAAARARMRERMGFSLAHGAGVAGLEVCCLDVEQLMRLRDVVGASAVREEAVVADAMEAAGQDVDQEAADELVDGERHHLGLVAAVGAVVLPPEGHAGVVEGDEPAVRDGDAVGVERKIGQHRLGTAERSLAVDDPFELAQRCEIGGEGAALVEVGVIGEELQAAGGMKGGELFQEQAPEQNSLTEAAGQSGCAGVKNRQQMAFVGKRRGRGMKGVELYAQVRYAVQDEGRPKKQRHTSKRIFERLRDEHGYAGGITIVKDYVLSRRLRHREVFVPLRHDPGHAQVDFGEALAEIAGVEGKIHFFAMDLPHSDACFVQAYPAETGEAFCDGHNAAFSFFGKVPRSILYDNTTLAVARILGDGVRQRTRVFSELQSHYVFADRFGRPGKGNDKGKVEGLIGWIRRNLLVPVPRAASFAALNEQLLEGCRRRLGDRLRGHEETIGERLVRDLAAFHFATSTLRRLREEDGPG